MDKDLINQGITNMFTSQPITDDQLSQMKAIFPIIFSLIEDTTVQAINEATSETFMSIFQQACKDVANFNLKMRYGL